MPKIPAGSRERSARPGGSPPEGRQTTTAAERQAAIDRELQKSLNEFDRLLLKEQKVLAQKRPVRAAADGGRSGSSGAGGGSGSRGSGGSQGGQSAGSRASSGAESGAGGASSRGSTESGSNVGSGPSSDAGNGESSRVPGDIPDGRDDDIVARQLREAAQNEDDPNLRALLWEEYRAYKNGRKARRSLPEKRQSAPPAEAENKETEESSDTTSSEGGGEEETQEPRR